ncbi:hypothetical protein TPHV1_130087 [Treponema phagedenis]|uniref:Uncharacterized protein n=1 Tax=Treponema phagedenis TaxID=162 RepID=A0A0B7GR42_TREPH|nr:hypothetical protein TPHV1_130087 [Treponema phagedenis]
MFYSVSFIVDIFSNVNLITNYVRRKSNYVRRKSLAVKRR